MENLILYAVMFFGLFGASCVVFTNRAVLAILSLIFVFLNTAIIWFMLGAEFLGVILILVYVGAVMVLFLFIVMMCNFNEDTKQNINILGVLVTVIFLSLLGYKIYFSLPLIGALDFSYIHNHPLQLAQLLYADYLLPFEVAGIILTVAIVAAISITFRRRDGVKRQNRFMQMEASKANRLKIIEDRD